MLLAVNGMIYHEQSVIIGASGEFLQTLDVARVPTGYYVVQLMDHQKLIGSYPVVILH